MISDAAAALQRGLDHHHAGRTEAAIGEYAACLALDPDNVDALNLRGLAEHQRGDNETALRLLARAHEMQPSFAGALQHLAEVQSAMGDLDAAQASFTKLAKLAPNWHGGPYGLGQILQRRGDAAGAARAYEAALVAKPDFAPAHFVLANIRAAQGDPAAGLAHMRAAVAAAPDVPENHNGLASLLFVNGDLAGAEAAFGACLALVPDHPGGLVGLGSILCMQRRFDEADAVSRRFLDRYPHNPEAIMLSGDVAYGRGQTSAALAAMSTALFLMVKAPPVADDRPATLFAALRAAARGLIDEDPNSVHWAAGDRWRTLAGNLGNLLAKLGELAAAADLYAAAAALGAREAHMNRATLALYDPAMDTAAIARVHRDLASAMRTGSPVPAGIAAPAVRPAAGRRIRIGYVSADMRHHSVARNLYPLFHTRDRERFEVFAYSLVAARDTITDHFAASADGWRDVARRTDGDIAATIRADAIDLLVHVAGHFDDNRLAIALHRPAPVQASLFDAATSGLPEIDYLFADAVQAPRGGREWFAERVVRLPNLYVHPPIDPAPEIRVRPADAPIAFASYSNPVKLNAPLLALWARVLDAVPGATLALGHHGAFEDAAVRARVERDFAAAGGSPARLRFRPSIAETNAHLAAYADIDVALDTFPFNGSTSTFEALWMGVPVVTLVGETIMSRWSAAMLLRLGLADLAARDAESYVSAAASLARDRQRLATLRATLRGRLAASSLCNSVRWTRRIERVYRAMVRRD